MPKQKICIKHFWYLTILLRKRTCAIKLQADLAVTMQQYFHSKEWLIDKLDFQTLVFGRRFLENKASLSLQGKQTALVINNKIPAVGWKLEVWITCIDHSELDSFPILKDLSDKIGGDINEHNNSDIMSILTFGRAA